MIEMVILYHFQKGLFEQCDIKTLEKSCTKLVSWKAEIFLCMFLYIYKEAKIFFF